MSFCIESVLRVNTSFCKYKEQINYAVVDLSALYSSTFSDKNFKRKELIVEILGNTSIF